MAVVTKNPSSLRMRYDCGKDPETDKTIIKSRTYSSVKHDATDDNVYKVGKAISSLQKHDLLETCKIDKSVLSE